MGAINPPGIEARDILGNRKRSGVWVFETGTGFSGKRFRVDGANKKIILESISLGANLSSISLNGSSQYLKTGTSYNFGTTYTYEIWFKLLSALATTGYLCDFWNGLSDHRIDIIPIGGGNHRLKYSFNAAQTSTDLIINTWYHVVSISGGGAKEIYVGTMAGNDILELSIANLTSMPTGSNLYDGTPGSTIIPLHAKFDDRRLWNTMRSPTEINLNKTLQLLGTETGLASYVQLNDLITFTTSPENIIDLVTGNVSTAIGFIGSNPFTVDVPFP